MAYENRCRDDDRTRYGGGYGEYRAGQGRGYGNDYRGGYGAGYAGDYGRGGSFSGYGGVLGPEGRQYDAGYGADVRGPYGQAGPYGDGYGRDYGRQPFAPGYIEGARGAGQRRDYRGEGRGFLDRASDEVQSWFGDNEAERRRRMDEQGQSRGRGPKNYARSDGRILEDVCDRLSDDPIVDAPEAEVSVSDREVTLSGTVDSREERRRAEDCAEQISGVTHVQNNIRVQPRTSEAGGTSDRT